MDTDTCIYCGSPTVIMTEDEHYLDQCCRILQCQNCRIMFTELEQRLEADGTPLDYRPKFDMRGEEAVLNAVWREWEKSSRTAAASCAIDWNRSLELLFLHKRPLKHPVEFIIFRDLWQLLDASKSYSLLDQYKNYNHGYTCRRLHEMLINNLQNIDYYLASYSEERRLSALQSLYGALLLLRNTPVYVGYVPDKEEAFAERIFRQRLEALKALAEQLENLHGSAHSREYLKMAASLWSRCQDAGSALDERFSASQNRNPYKDIVLSESERSPAQKKYAELSAEIQRFAPGFQAAKPPRKANMLFVWSTICIAIICFAPMVAFALDDRGINLLSDKVWVLLSQILIVAALLIIAGTILTVIITVGKENRQMRKEKAKRLQLHNRLYKNNQQGERHD